LGNHILTDVYPDLPKTIDRSLESNRVNASHKLMMIGALRDATFSLKTAQKKRRGKNSFQPGEKLMLHSAAPPQPKLWSSVLFGVRQLAKQACALQRGRPENVGKILARLRRIFGFISIGDTEKILSPWLCG